MTYTTRPSLNKSWRNYGPVHEYNRPHLNRALVAYVRMLAQFEDWTKMRDKAQVNDPNNGTEWVCQDTRLQFVVVGKPLILASVYVEVEKDPANDVLRQAWIMAINPDSNPKLPPRCHHNLQLDMTNPSFKRLKHAAEFMLRTKTGDHPVWKEILND